MHVLLHNAYPGLQPHPATPGLGQYWLGAIQPELSQHELLGMQVPLQAVVPAPQALQAPATQLWPVVQSVSEQQVTQVTEPGQRFKPDAQAARKLLM